MVKLEAQKRFSSSMEDYLEAIAMLGGERKAVRVNDISHSLNVKMPSVTSALKKLSQEGLVEHERYGYVGLTPQGDEIAQETIHRHKALIRFFAEALDVDEKTAETDACRIEHVISPLTLERMVKFVEFIQTCSLAETDFPKRYRYYVEHGELPKQRLVRDSKEKREGKNEKTRRIDLSHGS